MNYRHAFHAGNFADVLKHVTLLLLLEAMHRKPKPYFYLDTHAGDAGHRLDGPDALRTGEWREGVRRLWHSAPPEGVLTDYLAVVRGFPENEGAEPRFYPGSTMFARSRMRPDDRAAACEWRPEIARRLKQVFAGDGRFAVHRRDGYEALGALLPPRERRGVVLVDPPFEDADEFGRMSGALATAYRRWPAGVFALWYPLKEPDRVAEFQADVRRAGIRRVLAVSFARLPGDVPGRFSGCGMLIVNPPWRIDDALRVTLSSLLSRLAPDPRQARAGIDWLVGE